MLTQRTKRGDSREKSSMAMNNNQRGDENLMEMLSDDCLREVFKRLSIRDKLTVERVCKRWRELSTQGWPDHKEWNVTGSGAHTAKDSLQEDEKLTLKECSVALRRCGRYLTKVSFSLDATLVELPNMMNNVCDRLEEMTIWLPLNSPKPELVENFLRSMDDIFEGQKALKQAVIHVKKPHSNEFIHYIVNKSGNRWRRNSRFSRQRNSFSTKLRNIMNLLYFSANFHLK